MFVCKCRPVFSLDILVIQEPAGKEPIDLIGHASLPLSIMTSNLPRLDILKLGPDGNEKAPLISRLVPCYPIQEMLRAPFLSGFRDGFKWLEDLTFKKSSNPRDTNRTILPIQATDDQWDNGQWNSGQLSAEM